MKRANILKDIVSEKNKIIERLAYLGIPSSIKTLQSGKRVVSNSMLGILIEIYNKNFYDHKTKEIKELLNIGQTYSLTDSMSTTHLSYFLAALKVINRYINSINYLYSKSDKNGIKIKMEIIAKLERDSFKKENNNIPITHLIKENSSPRLMEMIKEKLKNFDSSFNQEDILSEIKVMADYLQKNMPKKYKDKKAYGTIMGKLNIGFYGKKNYEILEYLKQNKIKVPDGNILNLMDQEQLKYRFVCLQFIGSYFERYDESSFEKFQTRSLEIGEFAKMIYNENYQTYPIYDLKNKKNQNVEEKEILSEEQISIFELSDSKQRVLK